MRAIGLCVHFFLYAVVASTSITIFSYYFSNLHHFAELSPQIKQIAFFFFYGESESSTFAFWCV